MKLKDRIASKRTALLYLISCIVPVLCVLLTMIIKDAYPFGDRTILYGDVNSQIRCFVRDFIDIVYNHESLFWSFNGGMGYDFFSNFLYYLACPVTWIVLLFGKSHVEAGLVCVFLIYVSLCGPSFLYFLRHSRINKLRPSLYMDMLGVVCALAYAMCDYNLAYRFNIMWMPCLILAPLVMLGVEKLVHERKYGMYFVALLMSLLFNFYFSWFVCILSVIWFIEQEKAGIKDFLRKGIRFAGISIIAAISAAAVLLPAFFSILNQGRDGLSSLIESGVTSHASLGNFLQGFIWGHNVNRMGQYQFVQNNYCGIFVFILSLLYLITMEKNRQNIKRFFTIAIFAAGINVLCISYVLHGFSLPNGYNNRFAFILVILLIVSAYQMICDIDRLKMIHCVFLSICTIAALFIAMINSTEMAKTGAYIVSFILSCYILIILFLYARKSIKINALILNIVILGFCEIAGNMFYSNVNSSAENYDDVVNLSEWYDAYNDIDVSGEERKTAWVDGEFVFDASYTDIFLSITNSGMSDFLSRLGCLNSQTSVSYSVRGCTELVAAMFNVRYVLTDNPYEFGGFYYLYSYGDYDICENTSLAGLGYMTDNELISWDMESDNPFEVQNDYVSKAFGLEDLFVEPEFYDAQIYTDTCEITGCEDGLYTYVGTGSSDDLCEIDYSVVVSECEDLYFYLYNEYGYTYGIYVNGELIYYGSSSSLSDMLHIGQVEEGSEIDVCFFTTVDPDVEHRISFFLGDMKEDVFSECLADMKSGALNITELDDTYIKADIDVDEAGLLYTSIPYSDGFTAYVDGEQVEITVLCDTLICLELDEGHHVIELKYFPYGLKGGLLLSCIGIIIYICVIFINKKKMKTNIKGID